MTAMPVFLEKGPAMSRPREPSQPGTRAPPPVGVRGHFAPRSLASLTRPLTREVQVTAEPCSEPSSGS